MKSHRPTLTLISKIREASYRFIMKELEKKGIRGIVPSHGTILYWLYMQQGPMTMGELAEKIHKTKPTLTVLVNKLEELGYVRRQKGVEDTRVIYIHLTEQGDKFQKIFFEVSEQLNERFHEGLSDLDAEILEKILTQVSQNFQAI